MCCHLYLISDYTRVCSRCGKEESRITVSPTYNDSIPLWVGYSRSHRFRKILNKLFFPEKFGALNGEIHYRLSKKGPFKSIKLLINALKQLQSKDKNYNSLHLYCLYFLENCPSPRKPNAKIINDIIGDLEHLLTDLYPNRRFFSYRWYSVATKIWFVGLHSVCKTSCDWKNVFEIRVTV